MWFFFFFALRLPSPSHLHLLDNTSISAPWLTPRLSHYFPITDQTQRTADHTGYSGLRKWIKLWCLLHKRKERRGHVWLRKGLRINDESDRNSDRWVWNNFLCSTFPNTVPNCMYRKKKPIKYSKWSVGSLLLSTTMLRLYLSSRLPWNWWKYGLHLHRIMCCGFN